MSVEHHRPRLGTDAPVGTAAPVLVEEQEWQRLDPRMLFVHPVREVIRFLPALLAVLVAGTAAGRELWQAAFVVIPIVLGLLRYLTTSFRISGGRVELRRGLLNRHVLSTPIDRVRTVDLTSSPIQRVLGLTTVRVGTGTASTSGDERLDLDGLPVQRARVLREELLRTNPPEDQGASAEADQAPPPFEEVVVRFQPAWLRFAPLTGSGLVIAAAGLGALSQLFQTAGFMPRVDADALNAPTLPLAVLVPLLVLLALVFMALLSVGGYLVTNWGFRLTRTVAPRGASWHLTRGLFTTRETTLDDERLAGVSLAEPIGLRVAGGARLSAIVTGLDRSQQGSSALVPPAPRTAVERVAVAVLGTEGPVTGELVRHGAQATRRRWVRALVPASVPAGLAVIAVSRGASPWWLVALLALAVGAALAADRARSLGHALVDGHLVARSGSLSRRRRALDVEHVIGWNFSATWFQRRVGLCTLVATTAGGSQAVPILDIPEDQAVRLAERALPDLAEQVRVQNGTSPVA